MSSRAVKTRGGDSHGLWRKKTLFFFGQMVRWESLPQPPRLFSQPRLGITSDGHRPEGSIAARQACRAREPLPWAALLAFGASRSTHRRAARAPIAQDPVMVMIGTSFGARDLGRGRRSGALSQSKCRETL